jgi:uncharacterized protein YqeY
VLREKLSEATKDAMKSGEKLKLSTLRMVQAAIKNADIEARTGKGPLDDDAILGIMQKLIKQRQDSVELYEKGGRAELAKQENEEIAIIGSYLPKQMSDVEAGSAISAIVQEINAQTMKDMGRVMAALRERFAGQMDFGKASGAVKSLLAG